MYGPIWGSVHRDGKIATLERHVLLADGALEWGSGEEYAGIPIGGACISGIIDMPIGAGTGFATGSGKPCHWWQHLGCMFYSKEQATQAARTYCDAAAQLHENAVGSLLGQGFDGPYHCDVISVSVTKVGACKYDGECTIECGYG